MICEKTNWLANIGHSFPHNGGKNMAQITPQFEVENGRFVHNLLFLLLNIVVLKLFTGQQCVRMKTEEEGTAGPRSLPVNGVTEKDGPRRREGHRPR